jgi:hypothetical protein
MEPLAPGQRPTYPGLGPPADLCSRALDAEVVTELPPFMAALHGGRAYPREALGAIAAAVSAARAAHQSALSSPPPPIHHRQDIPGLLPEPSPTNLSGPRNLNLIRNGRPLKSCPNGTFAHSTCRPRI